MDASAIYRSGPPLICLSSKRQTWTNQFRRLFCLYLILIASICLTAVDFAAAAPALKLFRVDTSTGEKTHSPEVQTFFESLEVKSLSEISGACSRLNDFDERLNCTSDAMLESDALYKSHSLEENDIQLLVRIGDADRPSRLLNLQRWADAQGDPRVGTAWLLLLDADGRNEKDNERIKAAAKRWIERLAPNDLVNIVVLGHAELGESSKWLPTANKQTALTFVHKISSYPKSEKSRPLMTMIQKATASSFSTLLSFAPRHALPLHQAIVLLSSGYGGLDPLTSSPAAIEFRRILSKGQLDESNKAIPKAPIPLISLFYPRKNKELPLDDAYSFMQNLANAEVGGFFNGMLAGDESRIDRVIDRVRERLSKSYLARWDLACLDSRSEQSFQLLPKDINSGLIGDASFQNIPLGIDPLDWPLSLNQEQTRNAGEGSLYPGSELSIFGSFCWGGDLRRAEVYFIPAGQNIDPQMSARDMESGQAIQQRLIALDMKATVLDVGDGFVKIRVPSSDKLLHLSGGKLSAKIVVYDNEAKRISGLNRDSLLTLPARVAPSSPWLIISLIICGISIPIGTAITWLRKRNRARELRRTAFDASATPAPLTASTAELMPIMRELRAQSEAKKNQHNPSTSPKRDTHEMTPTPETDSPIRTKTPPPSETAYPTASRDDALLLDSNPREVFSSGPLISPPLAAKIDTQEFVDRAILEGEVGRFVVLAEMEALVGRDPQHSLIYIDRSEVSVLHAKLKIFELSLHVWDDGSTNHTAIDGINIEPKTWVPVPFDSILSFASCHFRVRRR